MMYLERFLYIRIAVIWNNRNLPSVCFTCVTVIFLFTNVRHSITALL